MFSLSVYPDSWPRSNSVYLQQQPYPSMCRCPITEAAQRVVFMTVGKWKCENMCEGFKCFLWLVCDRQGERSDIILKAVIQAGSEFFLFVSFLIFHNVWVIPSGGVGEEESERKDLYLWRCVQVSICYNQCYVTYAFCVFLDYIIIQSIN